MDQITAPIELAKQRRPLFLLAVIAAHAGLLGWMVMQHSMRHRTESAIRYLDMQVIAIPETKVLPVPKPATAAAPNQPVTRQRPPAQPPLPPKPAEQAPQAISLPPLELEAPASSAVEQTPRLDLEKFRKGALRYDKERELSPAEKLAHQQERDHSLEAQLAPGIEKATAKDCRKAYAGAGLLAPLAIAADLITTKKTCKW
jgi:hypothetical protein